MNVDSIKIDSGVKRIAINEDPERVLEINPGDVAFAERFYDLIQDFEAKQADYEKRAEQIDAVQEVNENGVPENIQERLGFLREICTYMREKIDYLFGDGTSQKIFGDALSLEMIGQFFQGLTPFVEQARAEKLAMYRSKPVGKKGRRVMK